MCSEYGPVEKRDAVKLNSEKLIYLTRKQSEAIFTFSHVPRVSISGPAGTGKTIVGIEHLKRKKVTPVNSCLYITSSSHLANWVGRNLADGIECFELNEFLNIIWRKYYTSQSYNKKYDVDSQEATTSINRFIRDLNGEKLHRFDHIVVDEAQNFSNEWLQFIIQKVWSGSENDMDFDDNECPTIRFLYDPEQTRESKTDDGKARTIQKAKEDLREFEHIYDVFRAKLSLNCRNSEEIQKKIETIKGETGPSPDITCNMSDLPGEIVKIIPAYRGGDPLSTTIIASIDQIDVNELKLDTPKDGRHNLSFHTWKTVTGLEADRVISIFSVHESDLKRQKRKRLKVASRAKMELYEIAVVDNSIKITKDKRLKK